MLTLPEVKVSFKAPARRLLRRAGAIVGKRQAYPVHFPSTTPSPISVTPEKPRRSPRMNSFRIALLSEVSVDDVIVVSALASAPFCCHADLLTMGTNQLIAVASVLNDALPPSLHIDVGAGRKPGEIRAEIEAIVGLRSPFKFLHRTTLVRPLPQFQLESLATYRGPTSKGGPLFQDMEYDSDISMSHSPQQRRQISPNPTAYVPTTTSQASSPSVAVLGSPTARSMAGTDIGPTVSYCMGQVPPRMSTPVNGIEINCELTFGLEGFTVEGSTELSSGSLHTVDVTVIP